MAVEPGHEDNARLVEFRRGFKDFSRQRHRRGHQRIVAGAVAGRELCERRIGGRRDRVEDAEQRVRMAFSVAGDQLRIVEIIAGEHHDTFGQPVAQGDFLVGVEQRDLYSLDLAGVALDQQNHGFQGFFEPVRAPVALQGRVEHGAEPVQDDLSRGLRQDAVVDMKIVLRPLGDGRQRAARHHDRLAAQPLDEADLLLVGGDDIVEAPGRAGRQVIGARARGEIGAGNGLRFRNRSGNQLLGALPVKSHAALRSVHRLGDPEAKRPQMAAEGHRALPVHRRPRPWIVHGKRVGDDMGGGIGDAGKAGAGNALNRLADKPVDFPPSAGAGQHDIHDFLPPDSWTPV